MGRLDFLEGNLLPSNNVARVTRSGWIDGETSSRDVRKESVPRAPNISETDRDDTRTKSRDIAPGYEALIPIDCNLTRVLCTRASLSFSLRAFHLLCESFLYIYTRSV